MTDSENTPEDTLDLAYSNPKPDGSTKGAPYSDEPATGNAPHSAAESPDAENSVSMRKEGSVVDPAAVDEDAVERLLLLTNRFNLVTLLGARLLMPMEAFRKYYPDLLQRVPGRIPLLTRPPDQALLDEVVGTAPNNFPVLIELSTLMDIEADRSCDGLVLVTGLIPWLRVARIHLPSERAMKEHAARPYANIHPHDDLLAVSPDLFVGGASPVAWPADEVPIRASSFDWNRLDRARGALNGARAASLNPPAIARLGGLLGADVPTPVAEPAEWLGILAAAQARTDTSSTASPPRKRSAVKPDAVLFAAAFEELIATDVQRDWSPKSVAQRIADRASEIATGRAKATIAKNMQHVTAVAGGEREFSPFKATGTGLITAKALLLVLLREDLSSLLAWPVDETNADALVMQTAAAFAGALRGISREHVAVRVPHFDDITANLLTGRPIGSVELASDSAVVSLNIDGKPVAEGAAIRPGIVEVLATLSVADHRLAVQRICERMGWGDVIVTTVHWSDEVSMRVHEGRCITVGSALSVTAEIDEGRLAARLSAEALDVALLDEVLASDSRGDDARQRQGTLRVDEGLSH